MHIGHKHPIAAKAEERVLQVLAQSREPLALDDICTKALVTQREAMSTYMDYVRDILRRAQVRQQ